MIAVLYCMKCSGVMTQVGGGCRGGRGPVFSRRRANPHRFSTLPYSSASIAAAIFSTSVFASIEFLFKSWQVWGHLFHFLFPGSGQSGCIVIIMS